MLKSLKLHIGIFGRRNVGKSSLMNIVTHQNVAIVAPIAGTTTDPVEKSMELLPLGPVVFIDTAGIDDDSELGEERVEKTKNILKRVDMALLVVAHEYGEYEEQFISEFKSKKIPFLIVFNKIDLIKPEESIVNGFKNRDINFVEISILKEQGIEDLRAALFAIAPQSFIKDPDMFGDLISEKDIVVLVTPIDKEAPKGRLIMPQIHAIRNILDHDCISVVAKENELSQILSMLKIKPKLVVTDSQAFKKVSEIVPNDIPMTSFSILMARLKGGLEQQIEGAKVIGKLKPKDKVLIAEVCTHHPIKDDIGRVKIPKLLNQFVGGDLTFEYVCGHTFPKNLDQYKLVVHCGACTINNREMIFRILECQKAGVAITNYGLAIAYCLGIFDRAIAEI